MPFPLIYPTVAQVIDPQERHQGLFVGSRPLGVTVHYTADRNMARARVADDGEGLGYHLTIDRDGKVYQTAYLDRMCSHAGEAVWESKSPNRHFAAVSLVSWGLLGGLGPEFKAWNGTIVPGEETALRPWNIPGRKDAYWDAATPEQCETLLQVLRWFMAFGVDPRMICGHDECAIPPGRKPDPGGILPWTMTELRAKLAAGTR